MLEFKTHRVSFERIEPDEGFLVWRTLQYFNLISDPNSFDSFGANYDLDLKTKADKLQAVYDCVGDSYRTKQAVCRILHFGLNFPVCNEIGDIAAGFEQANNFFTGFNSRWKIIIGAETTEKKEVCNVKVIYAKEGTPGGNKCSIFETYPQITTLQGCSDQAAKLFSESPDFSDICPGYQIFDVEFEMVEKLVWVKKPSDGVVLLESQNGLPDPTLLNQRLNGSSHMQVRNDSNTKQSLNRLFNNEIAEFPLVDPSGIWFYTPTR